MSPATPAPAESAIIATPKSSVWQRLVGGSLLSSIGLTGAFFQSLFPEAFRHNIVVNRVLVPLGWVALPLVVVAGVIAIVRTTREYSANPRTTSIDLPEPGGPWPRMRTPRPNPRLPSHPYGALLRELPMHDYEIDLLLEVLAAASTASSRLPVESVTGTVADMFQQAAATDLLDDLMRHRLVVPIGSGRCRLSRVPREPTRAEIRRTPAWTAACAELVRLHAVRAADRAAALDIPERAIGARQWFHAEEPRLRRLLRDCADLHPAIPPRAVTDLAAVADALDAWYARIGKDENATGVDTVLARIVPAAAFPVIAQLAALRIAPLEENTLRHYRPGALDTSLRARVAHRAALAELDSATPDLAKVVNRLERAWWQLPREDPAGEVCALVNLAIVHIRQGRLDAARDRLELAVSLAESGRDAPGLAHAHEIIGVLEWRLGAPRRALESWQLSLAGWRALGDELGTARCLQHLGSAAVVDPERSGFLLRRDGQAAVVEVLRQANGWLVKAAELDPGLKFTRAYRSRARQRFASANSSGSAPELRDRFERWPLPPRDQATGSG